MKPSNFFYITLGYGACTTTTVTYSSFNTMFLYDFDLDTSASLNTVMSLADYATITGSCSSFTLEDCSGNTLVSTSDLAITSSGVDKGIIKVTNDREFRETVCINVCGSVSS